MSGAVAVNSSLNFVGPDGDPGWPSSEIGSSGTRFPSYYFDHSEYPVGVAALVGSFTDELGQVVGQPFEIGFGATATIPAGATRLSLGVNDDIFFDNSGGFNVRISQTVVPEPNSLAIITAVFGISGGFWVRPRVVRRRCGNEASGKSG